MIKLPLWLLSVMILPVGVAAPEPQSTEPPQTVHSVDDQYPTLSLTPLSPWS
ncbi:MAG: hypothetical protein P8H96_01690 [Akkermansiaceae bacterium]|nr:hypothetical protein [Akkermansiaceae bacterium]